MKYLEKLVDASATYFRDQTITNATQTSAYKRNGAGGQVGAMEVIIRVNDAVALADTKVITLNIRHADDASGTNVATIETLTTTASGATTLAADTTLLRYVLPGNVKEFTCVQVISNDAGVAGSIDAFIAIPHGIATN